MALTALALLPAMLLPMGPPAAPVEVDRREVGADAPEPVLAAVD
jgi:hypothetical protein